MTSQIVELDSDTKALQICGPNGAEVRMGAMADGYVFMQYDGRTFITHARMNPDLYRNKEFDGKHASGAGLSTTLAYIIAKKITPEAFFDELSVHTDHALIRVWIRHPYPILSEEAVLHHVCALKFYALPKALITQAEEQRMKKVPNSD